MVATFQNFSVFSWQKESLRNLGKQKIIPLKNQTKKGNGFIKLEEKLTQQIGEKNFLNCRKKSF